MSVDVIVQVAMTLLIGFLLFERWMHERQDRRRARDLAVIHTDLAQAYRRLRELAGVDPIGAPVVTLAAWGASPEEAQRIFDAVVDAAIYVAPEGVTVDASATLKPEAD